MSSALVKCVVWDLDNTLWQGVIDEEVVVLPPENAALVRLLDEHGILQSIASRSSTRALAFLGERGLRDYFLCPQLGSEPKSTALQAIATHLRIGLDAIVFVDDEPFEREEVRFSHPQVRCFEPSQRDDLMTCLALPDVVTREGRGRRQMILSEQTRKEAQEQFVGPKEGFLTTLNMVLTISPPKESDLSRIEELLLRTHQFNATGRALSRSVLRGLMQSDGQLLAARLNDRFGDCGIIAAALVEREAELWTIRIFALSCRVANRGIGTLFLGHLMRSAKKAGVRLQCEFVHTSRNRPMFVMYRFAGFGESQSGFLKSDLIDLPPIPSCVRVEETA